MSSNTYGRQVVLPLTNKSGGSVAAGDVVIVDTGNNDAFTTTTTAGYTGTVGIATGTIANNAVGVVLISGYASLVNVNASVTRGDFGKTFTVAKQASDAGAARVAGTFCQFLTGGTTPDAVIYPADLAAAALTNPMNAVGDIIQGTTAGAPARLGAGTSGYVLTSAGAATPLVWAAAAGGTFVGCKAYMNGTQAITSGGTRIITFDTEDYDTSTFHDNVTNNGRMTVPTTGKYSVIAHLYAVTVGADCAFRVNAATQYSDVRLGPVAGQGMTWSADLLLTAADYVEVVVTPDSNVTLGHASARHAQNDFAIHFLGA